MDITEHRDLWNLLPSLCEQAGRKQHVVRTEGALSRKERALSALPCEAQGYQGLGEVFSQLKTKEYGNRLGGLESRENRMTDQGLFEGGEHRHPLLA